MRELRAVVAAVTIVTGTVLVSSTSAWAGLGDSATSTINLSTGVLTPPLALTANPGTCSFAGDKTVLSWTASTSSWASGYEIARSTVSGGPYTVIATVTGVATTTYTDSPPAFSTTYYYAVRATKHAWRSIDATASRRTKSSLCI